jgi:hypothetical protein
MRGLVAITIGLFQHFRKKRLSPSAWIAIGAFCFLIASYQAWLDATVEAEILKCTLEQIKDRAAARQQLATFFHESDKYIFAPLPKEISEQDYKKWLLNTSDWLIGVERWVGDNLGDSAKYKLDDVTNESPMDWNRAVSPAHNAVINHLIKIKQNIGGLLDDPRWDDRSTKLVSARNIGTELAPLCVSSDTGGLPTPQGAAYRASRSNSGDNDNASLVNPLQSVMLALFGIPLLTVFWNRSALLSMIGWLMCALALGFMLRWLPPMLFP